MSSYRGGDYGRHEGKYDPETDSDDFSEWSRSGSSDEFETMGLISLTCGKAFGFELDAAQEWSSVCLFVHFLHPVASSLNYVSYVSSAEDELGDGIVTWYRVMLVFAGLGFFLVASVFYMWAFRFHEDEHSASDRRTLGVLLNLLFADTPLFIIEIHIVWKVTWTRTTWLAIALTVTCISFAFSGIRVWLWGINKYLRSQERDYRQRPATLPGYKRAGPVYEERAGNKATFDGGGVPTSGWAIGDVAVDGWPADEPMPRGDLLDAEPLKQGEVARNL
eukprot:Hpha_TRINITY_DN16171_c3_g1::TRINITY_DN16171_c3_g1_i3::g.7638::m.7638